MQVSAAMHRQLSEMNPPRVVTNPSYLLEVPAAALEHVAADARAVQILRSHV
jgi:hypothetical protein